MKTFKDLALYKEEYKLQKAITESHNLLIEAPTGSGKSLFIPWFLNQKFNEKIVVLQPRRISALALANYSAKLCNEPCGKLIGYKFSQDSCKSNSTKILYQTYGNFLQEILRNKIDAKWVIFDEFHERKANMDLLFSYLLLLQKINLQKAPRILVMSAKLNRQELENALHVKCLELGYSMFPVQILYQKPVYGASLVSIQNLESEVIKALKTLYRNNIWQTTLVFLPGKAEIKRCIDTCINTLGEKLAEFLELYSGQKKQIQEQIFEETEKPRVIFTTNIAETSITVPNVTGVIDSGIERISEYDDNEKIYVLRTVNISLQNAIQRSGRCGRTQNGCAIRLWDKEYEKKMSKGIIPEITQIEPSELILQKKALESYTENFTQINLQTPIPTNREKTSLKNLEQLKLIQNGIITEIGKKTIQVPISNIPLALILASAKNKSHLDDSLLILMAWLHSGKETLQKSQIPLSIDFLIEGTKSKTISIPKEVQFTLLQLKEYKKNLKDNSENPIKNKKEFMLKQLLTAFPDCLATQNSNNTYKLSNEKIIRLQKEENSYAVLALSMIRTGMLKSELRINLYASISKDLIEHKNESINYELLWKNKDERFIGIEITSENNHEVARKEVIPQEASQKVLKELKGLTIDAWKNKFEKENWTNKFLSNKTETLLIKMQLASKLYQEYSLPEFNKEDLELIMDEFTEGIFLLKDLTEDRYRNIVEDYFGKSLIPFLNKTFPDTLILPNGKRANYKYYKVPYEEKNINPNINGFLVEISARIEDFINLRGEHFIADGKLKVRYDILAPNFRSIQKTWNITSFWKNTYQDIRKELRGRYPKHPWPESVI